MITYKEKKTELFNEELLWSKLDPLPIIRYIPEHQKAIVIWNGLIMPHSCALTLLFNNLSMPLTPSVREAVENDIKYCMDNNLIRTPKPVLSKNGEMRGRASLHDYRFNLQPHLAMLSQNYDRREMLMWFAYSNDPDYKEEQ